MTVLDRVPALPPGPGVSDTELLSAQLGGIAAWHRWRRARQLDLDTTLKGPGLSRETRLTITRRLDHVAATHAALLAWADGGHSPQGEASRPDRRPRAVLAHRNPWLHQKVSAALDERGVQVIASVDDGAAAIAVIVYEQPELILVEDLLPQVPGHEVVLRARELSPRSVVGVHAEDTQWMGRLLDAGARAWFSRRITPVDIASGLTQALNEADGAVVVP